MVHFKKNVKCNFILQFVVFYSTSARKLEIGIQLQKFRTFAQKQS